MARVVVEGARVDGLSEPDLDEGAHEALLELVLILTYPNLTLIHHEAKTEFAYPLLMSVPN